MNRFDGIEVETDATVELAIIWLHGLGADGHDFAGIVNELELPCGTRFVFPHAPERPVTINGGLRMRAWYDVYAFGFDAPTDTAGLSQSVKLVSELIDREAERGLAPERILLAGFSQGGAVVMHTAFEETRPLGGLLALSTYLPLAEQLTPPPSGVLAPVFMAHGTDDPVLPFRLGEVSRDRLTALGAEVEWHSYPMQHSVCLDEIRDIGHWLARFG